MSYSSRIITAIFDDIQEDTPPLFNLMVYSECTVSVAQSGLLLDAQSSGDLYF